MSTFMNKKRQVTIKRQETNIFNIKNENPNTNSQIKIQLSSKIIQIRFIQLCQYSEIAEEKYYKKDVQESLNNDIKLFQQKYNLKDQSIETFFNIIKEEDVIIVNNQFRDIFKLSELFEVKTLQSYLIKYAKSKLKDVNFKINLLGISSEEIETIKPNDEFSSTLEQLLSSQIAECIQNENFDKLNISTIYRIIEQNQKDIKSDALYKFIAKSIDDRYILFTFVDIASLSDINFNDLYKGYLERKNTDKSFYYQYLPNNIMYIKQLKDNIIKHEKIQSDKLMDEIKNLNSQVKTLKEKNNLLDSQIQTLKEQNNRLNSKFENFPPHLKIQAERIQSFIEKKKEMEKMINNNSGNNKEIKDIDFKTVKLILSDFQKRSSNVSPLYLGSQAGNIEVIKYLLSEGSVDINAIYKTKNEENTALTRAIINNNNLEIIKILLKNEKIDPNIKSVNYKEEYKQNDKCYRKCNYHHVHYSQKTPLYLAIEKENALLVQLLLSCPNIDINLKSIEIEGHIPFGERFGSIREYNEHSYPNNQYHQTYEKTPLFYAIEKNNMKIIQLLLEHAKIDINTDSSYSKGGKYENCCKCSDYDKGTINYRKPVLFLAIEKKSAEITQFLVSHPNIDFNVKSKYQYYHDNDVIKYEKTALYYAVEENNIQIVQILLTQQNIDVNLMSQEIKYHPCGIYIDTEIKKTALAVAIEKQYIDVIQYLLTCHNINVNIIFIETNTNDNRDYKYEQTKEKTSLYLVIESNCVQIAQLLITNPNIDVNIKITEKKIYKYINKDPNVNESFTTALHYAINCNRIEIIKLLLNNKQIDMNIPDNSGRTPLNLLGEKQILELLQKKES